MKNIFKNLSMLDMEPSKLKGIVVTHEHIDHVKGIGPLARKLGLPVYATAGLWEEMDRSIGRIGSEQRVVIEKEMTLAGMQIRLFETSHDSRESYGIKITDGQLSLGVATDSGIVTDDMNRHLQGCDAFVVEANHDLDALWNGRYPWHLKRGLIVTLAI
jgi:phosphoribosyl 1,2-cyclic phosphodiesterase